MRIGWKAHTSDPDIASYRYRVLTPVRTLSARGHPVEIFAEDRRNAYDLVVFSKAYREPDQALATALRRAGCEVVLDLCDNHFYNPSGLAAYDKARDDLLAMMALCNRVICSTPALARIVMSEAGLPHLPAVVGDVFEDLGRLAPETGPEGSLPRLVWFGLHGSPNAPAGMTDILLIAPQLAEAFSCTPFELVVISNNRGKFDEHIAPLPIETRYLDWERKSFAAELARAHAVILPLSQNPFVACKTHNRLSLALAAGVPVVADAIESYREFAPYCRLGDWEAGLNGVLTNAAAARRRAAGARTYLKAHWSNHAVARQWEAALNLPAPARSEIGSVDAAGAGARPHGELKRSPKGCLFGWAQDADGAASGLRVELTVNGARVGTAAADLPTMALEKGAGERPLRKDGGFVFPREILPATDGELFRCTLRLAGTREPVVNTMLDLHQPAQRSKVAADAETGPI